MGQFRQVKIKAQGQVWAVMNITTTRRLEIVKLKNLSALDGKLAAYDDDL